MQELPGTVPEAAAANSALTRADISNARRRGMAAQVGPEAAAIDGANTTAEAVQDPVTARSASPRNGGHRRAIVKGVAFRTERMVSRARGAGPGTAAVQRSSLLKDPAVIRGNGNERMLLTSWSLRSSVGAS